jgi:hypothetical protein
MSRTRGSVRFDSPGGALAGAEVSLGAWATTTQAANPEAANTVRISVVVAIHARMDEL